MNEYPIIFSVPMVEAIIEGRKTQTRRVMQLQPSIDPQVITNPRVAATYAGPSYGGQALAVWPGESEFDFCDCHCRYGNIGWTLWVRETWRQAWPATSYSPGIVFRADKKASLGMDEYSDRHRWRSSIHLKREHARRFLTISGVRAERVQDISEEDAKAEGAPPPKLHAYGCEPFDEPCEHRVGFRTLWDSLNLKRGHGWHTNPYVWVIEFEVAKR